MADYDLSRLETRSFEQLIQAIALKVIGPKTIIFGDGRDGGREATFEGKISYGEPAWHGYGVMQAKFRQRLQGAPKDAQWALKALKSDLKKFTDPKRKLRQPEYYIFVTNVVLTPTQNTGSKDKLFALLKEFQEQKTLPLKDYDIWDHDKICRFLDDNEDIRRAYGAWITPGDVLAKMMEWLDVRTPNFEQVMSNFLQKELLADLYANLEQAGHNPEERIPLARVFVDLPTFNERHINPPEQEKKTEQLLPGFVAEILTVAKERLAPQPSASHLSRQSHFSLQAATPERGRFVLLGGPGQGKTTVGQFICQLFRAAILKQRPNVLIPETQRALTELEKQCHQEKIDFPSVPRFPFYISLNEFAAKFASEAEPDINSLLSYMVDRIRRRTDQEITPNDLRCWLGGYPWLIVLDGLDEVPATSNRAAVLRAISDFWVDANECQADILVIATTRPQGYNDDYSPQDYHHKWLAPLSTVRALHYGSRLAEVRYGNNPDRKEKVITRLQRASEQETTARLMQSPLQVTIMATLVDRMGQPPQERWKLFKEYYKVIYQRELERDIPTSQILRDYQADIDAIHNRVGLLLQVESDQSGQTDARLPIDRFASLVDQRLSEEGHEEEELDALSRKIIHAATDRLVFLVSLQADEVGFEIRSLQEFMAAEALMDGSDEMIRQRLRQIAPLISWRNVFLFAAGKCFVERQHLRDTIHAICAELNEETEDEISSISLAGSQLAVDLLEDLPVTGQPKYARLLARQALRLLELPPDDYHIRLGDLYTPKLDKIYRQELQRGMALSHQSHRLGAWAVLISLVKADVPWAEELARTYWPNNKDEKFELLQLAGEHKNGGWMIPELVDVIPLMSPVDFDNKQGRALVRICAEHTGLMWLEAVQKLATSYSDDYDVPLYLLDREEEFFRLRATMIRGPESLFGFTEMPDASPDWLPLVAGADFASKPSKSKLAEVVRMIADDFSSPGTKYAFNRVPWPLGACLEATSTQEELYEIAERVERGELGDIQDWRAAERRWETDGITIQDIEYMTDEHWPFDEQISNFGFPFTVLNTFIESIGIININYNTNVFMDYNNIFLSKLYKLIISSNTESLLKKKFLLFLIMIITFHVEDTTKILKEITNNNFKIIIKIIIVNKIRIEIYTLWLLIKKNTSDDEWLEFLDNIGKHNLIYPIRRVSDELLKPLSEAFCYSPSRLGILWILAVLAFKGSSPTVPTNFLDPQRYDEPRYRQAAIMVRLAQEDWDESEGKKLAKHITQLLTKCPDADISALELLEKHEKSGVAVEQFLLELHKGLPTTRWQTKKRIIDMMNNSLSRRISRLGESQNWARLGLPEGLNDLIRQ